MAADKRAEAADHTQHDQISNRECRGATCRAQPPVDAVEQRVEQIGEHQRDREDEKRFADQIDDAQQEKHERGRPGVTRRFQVNSQHAARFSAGLPLGLPLALPMAPRKALV